METKYRLLDEGELIEIGDEWLNPDWVPVPASLLGSMCSIRPMRRIDDGNGEYILIERPGVVEPCISTDASFWKWNVGWVKADETSRNEDAAIWRKARKVEKPPGLWVVIHTAGPCEDYTKLGNDIIFTSWEEACDAAKHQARINGDGAEFAVAHIDRTFKCEVSVVEKEVSK